MESYFRLPNKIILGSGSPRRKELLAALGVEFEVKTYPTEELFSAEIPVFEVAEYLAKQKAEAFPEVDAANSLIICADTTVIAGQTILNKAADVSEAKEMLRLLSGKTHYVATGVCLRFSDQLKSFTDVCEVQFSSIGEAEMDFYIKHFKPFDKAGAYGIQEWIGMALIEKISGSYFTVMGFPTHLIFKELKEFSKNLTLS